MAKIDVNSFPANVTVSSLLITLKKLSVYENIVLFFESRLKYEISAHCLAV
jgi:hypothetical protein